MSYLEGIRSFRVKAGMEYLYNGGKLDEDDARLLMYDFFEEAQHAIAYEIGDSFFNKYYPSSRCNGHWKIPDPIGIIDHYTAGIKASSTLRWFSNKERPGGSSNSSAHFLVSREGIIYGVISPFRIAWHARRHNATHLGIEHVNAGILKKKGKRFYYMNEFKYPKKRESALIQVGKEIWEPYTAEQLEANVILKRLITQTFPNVTKSNCIDHQMADPERKKDCGPLWPMPILNDLAFSNRNLNMIDWEKLLTTWYVQKKIDVSSPSVHS